MNDRPCHFPMGRFMALAGMESCSAAPNGREVSAPLLMVGWIVG
jgi:hypothetical protein